ncbi:hypothetical protein EZV62_002277 [Acer yangbiense]|uniref:Glycosyltransferase 2-like domain-containing protein n=1 Tax=Acer yangbiense TaxID=1000413 RepID=A0A5C7IX55_9ROSI|nr:hypothetical protein EZV62_002277 [Acer yangbiense]
MSLMLFMERVYMGIVIILVKIFWKKPEKRYNWEAIQDDEELGSTNFPFVLVQIPMFNEKEVYKISIGAACGLSWPSDRLVIQVLDDSTDPAIKRSYVKHCEYVAIFDADFRPEPDYLRRAIPFLVNNPNIALVQARWRFGTAGVWRIAAINEAGGWKDRTTVEDMDLAVRAGLKGWKFVYLGDLQVKSELPSTFKAFRFQQHRWSCGPANLFRKMVMEIVRNKIIAHMVTFCFYCVVLPLTILVPEVKVPIWGAVYIPSVITILNSVGTPRSIHLLFYWILFENVMSLHRTKATLIGLFEAGRVNEWVVTEKLGDAVKNKAAADAKNKNNIKSPKRLKFKFTDRINTLELGFGVFLFFCGCYDFVHGKNNYFVYLFLQTITFFITGFGYIGTIV